MLNCDIIWSSWYFVASLNTKCKSCSSYNNNNNWQSGHITNSDGHFIRAAGQKAIIIALLYM